VLGNKGRREKRHTAFLFIDIFDARADPHFDGLDGDGLILCFIVTQGILCQHKPALPPRLEVAPKLSQVAGFENFDVL